MPTSARCWVTLPRAARVARSFLTHRTSALRRKNESFTSRTFRHGACIVEGNFPLKRCRPMHQPKRNSSGSTRRHLPTLTLEEIAPRPLREIVVGPGGDPSEAAPTGVYNPSSDNEPTEPRPFADEATSSAG